MESAPLSITALYAALLGLMLIVVSIRVVRLRVEHKIDLFDGGIDELGGDRPGGAPRPRTLRRRLSRGPVKGGPSRYPPISPNPLTATNSAIDPLALIR